MLGGGVEVVALVLRDLRLEVIDLRLQVGQQLVIPASHSFDYALYGPVTDLEAGKALMAIKFIRSLGIPLSSAMANKGTANWQRNTNTAEIVKAQVAIMTNSYKRGGAPLYMLHSDVSRAYFNAPVKGDIL